LTAVGTLAQSPSLSLSLRHFQPFFPPQSLHAFVVDPPAFSPQLAGRCPVSPSRFGITDLFEPPRLPIFLITSLGGVAVRAARLSHHFTGPALAGVTLLYQMRHRFALARRAYHFPSTSSFINAKSNA
jgi:hypothetical protein